MVAVRELELAVPVVTGAFAEAVLVGEGVCALTTGAAATNIPTAIDSAASTPRAVCQRVPAAIL